MKKIERIISIGLISFLIIFGLLKLSSIVERKDADYKYGPFFQNANDIDVLYFGTSHIQNGFSSLELWDEYGITSYNFGGAGNRLPTSYWIMENALDYASPKLVIIDGAYLYYDTKVHSQAFLHDTMDAFPLSKTKIKAIFDLLDDNEERFEYLFNFSLYHNRWNELTDYDFYRIYTPMMGMTSSIGVSDEPAIIDFTQDNKSTATKVDTIGVEYLEKMIEECKSRDIEVLLTFMPYQMNEQSKNDSIFIEDIARKYNVGYIGINEVADLINPETDFCNSVDDNSHMNLLGASKYTDFIGNYILNNYENIQCNDNVVTDKWNNYYITYLQNRMNVISSREDINAYLSSIYLSDFEVIVYDQAEQKSETINALLDEYGLQGETDNKTKGQLHIYNMATGNRKTVNGEIDMIETESTTVCVSKNEKIINVGIGGITATINEDSNIIVFAVVNVNTGNVFSVVSFDPMDINGHIEVYNQN